MKKAAIIILLIIAVLFLSVYAWLRSQVPDYNQSIEAPGLTDVVTVTRNEYAVPTITAKNDDDLYFAWGYVNAQDRMFQLEVTRRIGQGRISEFGGRAAERGSLARAVIMNETWEKEPEWIRV